MIDLELYPGKEIPLSKQAVLGCQIRFEKMRESVASIFGYTYQPYELQVSPEMNEAMNKKSSKKSDDSRSGYDNRSGYYSRPSYDSRSSYYNRPLGYDRKYTQNNRYNNRYSNNSGYNNGTRRQYRR